ncbi:M23 family metallopeptidase [Leifsonia aquatica]|uniref:M23 family metallopeptidase n=1 Tax=Leifsonia aquatica TaxID=144185 RepID=UPI000469898B|nr:M23 family metallopeptidase [Leifsonia aquatica]
MGKQAVAIALMGSAATAPAGATAAIAEPQAFTAELQTIEPTDFHTWSLSRDPVSVIAAPQVVWPVAAEAEITDLFGPRQAPTPDASTVHKGIDLAGPVGMPVHLVLAGTVITARGFDAGGCGVYAEIAHRHQGSEIITKYCHLQPGSLMDSVGQSVGAGDVLGHMGNSGISTGPHLHFKLIIDGSHVDPLPWLSARAGR